MNKRKTINGDGKKGRTPKTKNENQNQSTEMSVVKKQKEIDLLVCSNGNTVCCIKKSDGTIQLLGGKIDEDENSTSAAWRISQTKSGSGMFGIKKEKTIQFQDPGDSGNEKVKVNIFTAETPVNNSPKEGEIWVPVSLLLNKSHINGKEIRPLTKAVVTEMVAKGFLKTEVTEEFAKANS